MTSQRDAFTRRVNVGVGRRIRRRRRLIELSQESLAELAGLHRSQITLIETGRRLPRLDTLIRLATVLGVSPCQLVAGIEWKPDWSLPDVDTGADKEIESDHRATDVTKTNESSQGGPSVQKRSRP